MLAYDSNSLLDASSWPNNVVQATGPSAKYFADDFPFDATQVTSASAQGGYFNNYALESPTLPPAQVFDTGLPGSNSGGGVHAHSTVTVAQMPSTQAPLSVNALAANLQRVAESVGGMNVGANINALQLDTATLTPSGSPRTSHYASPSFELSPTPALTHPTASTPGPRSHSRCSSHSSADGLASGLTSVVVTPGPISPILPIRASLGGGGRKNSAVANGSFIPKKSHLCPYEACERHTRTFRSNADLQRHIRSHKGEKPHKCPSNDCQKAYGQQNKMVKHVESQHPHLLSMVELGRTRTRRAAMPQRSVSANIRRVGMASSPFAKAPVMSYNSYPSTPVQSPPHTAAAPGSAGSMYHSPLGGFHNNHGHHSRPAPYPPRSAAPLHQMARTNSTGSTGSVGALGAGFTLPPAFGGSYSAQQPTWWSQS